MNGTTHKIGGTCTAIVMLVTKGMEWKTAALFVFGSYIGSIFPDIDEPGSTIGRKLKPISIMINKIFKHRGMVHTPFFLVISNIILYYCFDLSPEGIMFLGGFNVGFISHLLLDLLTPQGIMVLYPLSKIRFKMFGFSSKNRDFFFSLIIILVTIIITIPLHLLW